MPATPSKAEDPNNGATTSSTECVPHMQSLAMRQPLRCAAPGGQRVPMGNPPGPHGVGESSLHAGTPAPDFSGFFPATDQHAAGPALADFQPASSCASRPLPSVAPAGDTAPATTSPAPTDFALDADSSPPDPNTDSPEDPAGTIGSPVAPGHSIAVDNQQIPLAHPYGTRLRNNIRQLKTRTNGTITYSVSRVSSLEPSSDVTAIKHPLWRWAMHDEFDALLNNKTWHLVPPRACLNVIDCKWVFQQA
jgi:hypothetical protein